MGQCAQFVIMHLAIGACLVVVLANWRIERPSMQLHLFGSKASSFLFPNVPPGQEEGEGGGGCRLWRQREDYKSLYCWLLGQEGG